MARHANDAEALSTATQRGVLLLRAAALGVEAAVAAAAAGDELRARKFVEDLLESIEDDGTDTDVLYDTQVDRTQSVKLLRLEVERW